MRRGLPTGSGRPAQEPPFAVETAREYARIKIDGLRLVGGNPDFTNGGPTRPGTATTTQASTTGSKLTYTLAGDSPGQILAILSYYLRNRRNQSQLGLA